MSSVKCPNCGEAIVPILYGYPSLNAFERSKKGEFALGGCVIGADDPQHHCSNCQAAVWSHGVYSTDEDLRVRLGTPRSSLEASLPVGGPLWISDSDGTVVTIAREDVQLVALVCLVEQFDDGMKFGRWLRARWLPFSGEVTGPVLRFGFSHDECLSASSGDQALTVEGALERLTLHLLRDAARRNRLRTPADIAEWLAGPLWSSQTKEE